MATHADISGNLAIAALQSVRRNASNTTFEAYTPMFASMGAIESVASIHYTGRNTDIASTSISGTDVPGYYLVCIRSYTDKVDPAAGYVQVSISHTESIVRTYGDNVDLDILGEIGLSLTFALVVDTGSITYSAINTGGYGAASYTLVISVIRLMSFGRMTGTAAGVAAQTGTLTGA